MCECMECITLNIINTLLSIVIILMNGIYVIWGLMLPHSQAKEVWKEYIERLELYVNVVSYSDAVILPMKIVAMILLKWFCCKCNKQLKQDEDNFECTGSRDIYDNTVSKPCKSYRSSMKVMRNGAAEFRVES